MYLPDIRNLVILFQNKVFDKSEIFLEKNLCTSLEKMNEKIIILTLNSWSCNRKKIYPPIGMSGIHDQFKDSNFILKIIDELKRVNF